MFIAFFFKAQCPAAARISSTSLALLRGTEYEDVSFQFSKLTQISFVDPPSPYTGTKVLMFDFLKAFSGFWSSKMDSNKTIACLKMLDILPLTTFPKSHSAVSRYCCWLLYTAFPLISSSVVSWKSRWSWNRKPYSCLTSSVGFVCLLLILHALVLRLSFKSASVTKCKLD